MFVGSPMPVGNSGPARVAHVRMRARSVKGRHCTGRSKWHLRMMASGRFGLTPPKPRSQVNTFEVLAKGESCFRNAPRDAKVRALSRQEGAKQRKRDAAKLRRNTNILIALVFGKVIERKVAAAKLAVA